MFVAVIGSESTISLALLLATAALGGIFSSFATDLGQKVSIYRNGAGF